MGDTSAVPATGYRAVWIVCHKTGCTARYTTHLRTDHTVEYANDDMALYTVPVFRYWVRRSIALTTLAEDIFGW